MNIDLVCTWEEARHADVSGRTAIVIDVLRATSSMAAALNAGARSVHAVATVEDARGLAERLGREDTVLGGERESVRLPGFDLGNSPLEYTGDVVAGKRIVMTTTNGTQAIDAVAKAVKNREALSRAGLYWNARCLKAIGAPKFWPKETLQPIIDAWRASLPKGPPRKLPICK